MGRSSPWVTLFLLSAAALPAAAGTLTLNADQAVALALERNLQLQSSRIDLQTAEREKKNAWNVWLPGVTAGASLSRSNELSTASRSAGASDWNLGASLQASLPLTPAIPASIRSTVLAYEAGQLTHESARRRLERDVRKAFYGLLVARESIRLAEQQLATAGQQYQQTKKNYEAGLTSRLKVLAAQVNAENLKPALEQQRAGYESTLMDFRLLLGLDNADELRLEGTIEVTAYRLDADELIRKHLERRLDIQSLQKQVESRQNEKRLQKASSLGPILSVSASLGPTLNGPFDSDRLGGNSWQDAGSVGVSVQVPLGGHLRGSSTQVKLAALDDRVAKARLELEQGRRAAANEIRSTVLQLQQALRSIEALQLNVTLAEEAYSLTNQAYRSGTQTLLELQSAADDLQQTLVSLLNEKYTYLSGLLDLEVALNSSLDALEVDHD